MKVLILAGGFGTRISEYTQSIPKPMIRIGELPIIHHIINVYSSYGFNDFVIALGYKSHVIKNYFHDLFGLSGDFTLDFDQHAIVKHAREVPPWRITFVETGIESLTGGRVLNCRDYLSESRFMVTYGDGLSNVNLHDLLDHHLKYGLTATVTAVRPQARFGEMIISNNSVTSFKEKPQLSAGFINGGFFVFEPSIFNYIDSAQTVLEGSPLETLAAEGNLCAYIHEGFWQCMDTKRDHDLLTKLAESNPCPWVRK